MKYIFKQCHYIKKFEVKVDKNTYPVKRVLKYLSDNMKAVRKILDREDLSYSELPTLCSFEHTSYTQKVSCTYDKDVELFETETSLDGLEVGDNYYIKELDKMVTIDKVTKTNDVTIFIIEEKSYEAINQESVEKEVQEKDVPLETIENAYAQQYFEEWAAKIEQYKAQHPEEFSPIHCLTTGFNDFLQNVKRNFK